MKSYFYLIIFLLPGLRSHAQHYYVAFNPFDCPNCLKGIELSTDKNECTYIFQEEYRVDSASLRKRYLFSDQAQMLFSDTLFEKYAINGRSVISNKAGTLKCLSANFDRETSDIFKKLNSGKDADTFIFRYPVSKSALIKRLFTEDGKVYMLDMLANNVVVYDLFHDKVLYTLKIDENDTRKGYELFGGGNDTGAYAYYKAGVARFTQDDLASISDISLYKDTLCLSIANYYFYTGGKNMDDSFFTKFQSIGLYKDGQYLTTYVPDNIKDKLLDTAKLFNSEPSSIYKFEENIYTSIYNGKYYTGKEKYAVGRYSPAKNILEGMVKLNKDYYSDYNFSNPKFSDRFFVLSKSPELYSIDSGYMVDLDYFKQGRLAGYIVPDFPEYFNEDMSVDSLYYNILYYSNADKTYFYARIERKSNKLQARKTLPAFENMWVYIDPYDNNYVIAFYDNNKMIRYKVFED